MTRRSSLALLAACLASSAAGQTRAEDGPGDGFDVISYRLSLTPDIRDRTVAARETIRLRTTASGIRRLRFSGNALTIESAAVDGVAVAPEREGEELDFAMPEAIARGRTVTLELSYRGRPKRGLAGSATGLYTSYFACDWMICAQDRFGDKAAFALDLQVPAGMETLSVGRQTARRAGPDGSVIHSWKAPRPYSAYLYGFAVGRFARIGKRAGSARIAFLSDVAEPAGLKRRFAETGAMVRFLSGKAGVPLPVAEYSQLLVEGDEAQEAATYSVLGTDALPAAAGDPTEDWAIVHELAHQWWGNLVTCATLGDFWLNEGITTFMTAAWKEHRYGRAAYAAELDGARRRLDKARAADFDKPLAWDGRYPTLGTRRAVQYGKGALFMDQLRTTLGDAAFWAGLRRYTRTHAGGTVASIDLESAMEAASGRDLRPLFAQWVFGERPLGSEPVSRSAR